MSMKCKNNGKRLKMSQEPVATTAGELVETKNVLEVEWKIGNFVSLKREDRRKSECFTLLKSWYMKIYPYSKDREYVGLFICREDDEDYSDTDSESDLDSDDNDDYLPSCVTFRLGVKTASGKIENKYQCIKKGICKSYSCGTEKFLSRNELEDRVSNLTPLGDLTVTCSVTIDETDKTETDVRNMEKAQTLKSKSCDKLHCDLKELMLNGQVNDVILKVQGKEFKTHKAILVARSPVFSAMFQHNTTENATGDIHIEDINPFAFSHFLYYLYSGNLEANLSLDRVLELYIVADKYQVGELKEECLHFMLSNITEENICDILTLSLQYSEKELNEAVTGFFIDNAENIIQSVKWQLFLNSNTVEGNELFLKYIQSRKW